MELFCVKPPDLAAHQSTLKECKIAVKAKNEPSAFQNEFPPVASARTSDNSASGILRANEPDSPVLSRLVHTCTRTFTLRSFLFRLLCVFPLNINIHGLLRLLLSGFNTSIKSIQCTKDVFIPQGAVRSGGLIKPKNNTGRIRIDKSMNTQVNNNTNHILLLLLSLIHI